MNKNTVYILQKDYESPICKVHKGFRYTAKEWLRYFPKLSPEDFDIKTDWFKPKDDLQAVNSVRTEWWEEEIIKCIKSPYYFATQYLIVNDKPFTTPLNEKQFNSYFGMKQQFYAPKEHVDESKPTEQPLWEILEIYRPSDNLLHTTSKQDIRILFFENPEKEFAPYSVKRLPDNTVWSVDMVTAQGKITGFHIEKGIMVAEFENNTWHCDLMLLTEAPKEEQVPIKVSHITSHDTIDFRDKTVYSHAVWVSQPIPESKYQSIKEAIEGVLNEYIKFKWHEFRPSPTEQQVNSPLFQAIWSVIKGWDIDTSDKKPRVNYHGANGSDVLLIMDSIKNMKLYTESELLQARRDAFDAARVRIATYDGEQYFPTTKVKYKDNEDYINTLNK